MKFILDWNITTYEATATGGHQGKKKSWYIGSRALYFYWIISKKKKIKFYMRGAESSK